MRLLQRVRRQARLVAAGRRRPRRSTSPCRALYRPQRGRSPASFALSLVGWVVGTGEVWLIAAASRITRSSWRDALLLESLGQAIRGAAFAIPGSLGVQEGGYLLLAPLVGLPPEAALALSLAKRARELLLGRAGPAVPALLPNELAAPAARAAVALSE